MDERGNMRLLLCDGLLAERPYQDLYVDTWWENSALRKWLNGRFCEGVLRAGGGAKYSERARGNPRQRGILYQRRRERKFA